MPNRAGRQPQAADAARDDGTGVYAGHWAETNVGGAAVTWVGGKWIETERCEGDEEKIIAAIRPAIPAPQLEPDPS